MTDKPFVSTDGLYFQPSGGGAHDTAVNRMASIDRIRRFLKDQEWSEGVGAAFDFLDRWLGVRGKAARLDLMRAYRLDEEDSYKRELWDDARKRIGVLLDRLERNPPATDTI